VSELAKPDRPALEALLRKAEDCAGFAMRKIGRVPATFLAATPSGLPRKATHSKVASRT